MHIILYITAIFIASFFYTPTAQAACSTAGFLVKCDTVDDVFADYQARLAVNAYQGTVIPAGREWPASYGAIMELGFHVGYGASGPIMMEHKPLPSEYSSFGGVGYLLGAAEYFTAAYGTGWYWSEIVPGAMRVYASLETVFLDVFKIEDGVDYGLEPYSQTFPTLLVFVNEIPYQTVPAPVTVPGPEAGAGLASLVLVVTVGLIRRRRTIS